MLHGIRRSDPRHRRHRPDQGRRPQRALGCRLCPGNDATLFKKDCDEPHEAEIAVADEFDARHVDAFLPGFPEGVCSDLLSEEYATAFDTEEYDIGLVFEADEPESGDDLVCYLERADGDDLEQPIVD